MKWLQKEVNRVDRNDIYDWDLRTPQIEFAIARTNEIINAYLDGEETWEAAERSVRVWFHTVWTETLEVWKAKRVQARADYEKSKTVPLPIQDVPIHYRELPFLQERFENWMLKDGSQCYEDFVFDNKLEFNYDYIEIDWTVNEGHTLSFKKYKGRTVKEILEIDPDYLIWCHHKIEGFTLHADTFAKAVKNTEKHRAQGRYE